MTCTERAECDDCVYRLNIEQIVNGKLL